MRPELPLQLEAEYICADYVSVPACSLLQTDGGPYIIANNHDMRSRFFSHPLTALALRVSSGQTFQFVVLIHRYIIVDHPPVIL